MNKWRYAPEKTCGSTVHILSIGDEQPTGRVYKIQIGAYDKFEGERDGQPVTMHRLILDDPRFEEIIKSVQDALNEDTVSLEKYNTDMYGKHPVDEVSE